jgi:endo-1,4-beta-mannosidase
VLRNFAKLPGPVWLGANFWSRLGGPLMWRRFDADVVRQELDVLAAHGLTATRSFCYWPDFMPAPDLVDEKLLAHFAQFLDLHVDAGMTTIPTFIVGHMSGQNWDPSWRAGRDLYTDVWLVARQAWFVEQVAGRFADHPAIAAWLISNEMPLYGGTASADVVGSWARLMVHAVRAGGARQPVSIGDGAWGVEMTGEDTGFSVRELGELVDFTGPHVYRMESDVVRQYLKAAFVCELAAVGGRPVVLEEFGLSSDFVSPDNAAHYYRQTLHQSLLSGATGWLAWNNTDFDDLVDQDPYRHHPFELHFGLTTSDGAPKPTLREMHDFADVLAGVDVARCERWPAAAALLVAEALESPHIVADDRRFVAAALEQAYVAAREADLPVAFLRERDGVEPGAALYLVPSAKQLTGPTWLRLRQLAGAGATVYVSYAAGESSFQRGPWWTGTEALFGVRPELVYGLNDPVDGPVTITFSEDFGSIEAGSSLTVLASGGDNARAYLPVVATDGRVIARDQYERPAVVRKDYGPGTAVLATYPLEYFAAARGRVNPEDTWRLYDALAVHAGIERPVQVDDPRVLVDGLVHADGRRFAWLTSLHDAPLTVRPRTVSRTHLADLATATPVDRVTLPPYGVRVLQLTNKGATP